MRTLILAFVLFFGMATAHAASSFGDGIAAIVSTTVISTHELQQRTALTYRQVGESKLTEADKKYLENKSLMGLIDEEIQRQFANANGIRVSPDDLAKYKAAIGKQVNLAEIGKGLEVTLNRKLEGEIRWQKIVAEIVRPRIYIGQAEIDQLIKGMLKGRHVVERDISQILLSVNDKSEEEAKHARIEEVAQKLKDGAKFEDMAKQYSDDETTAKEGGHMGWFASGELNPQLEDALDKLEPGQISGVIRTPLGWHIIRLDNVRTTKPVDENDEANMAQYRARVREHLTANRVELESRRLMREMRQRAFVDIRK